MMYQMTIVRLDKNPNYESELEKWEQQSRYGASSFKNGGLIMTSPEQNIISNALNVTLTEEQFRAIKAEVFKSFE